MNIFQYAARLSTPRLGTQISACLLSLVLLFSTWTQSLRAYQDTQAPARAIQAPPHA
jgi:hypothetical protein